MGTLIGTKLAVTFYYERECLQLICGICKHGSWIMEPEPRRLLMNFKVIQFNNKGACIPKDQKEFREFKKYVTSYGKKCKMCNEKDT